MKIIHTLPFIPKMEKYQSWKNYVGKNYGDRTPLAYMENDFDYEDTVLFSQILFPSFVEREGGIFIAFLYSDEKFDEFREEYSINKVEEFINELWLANIFHGCRNYDMGLLDELAEMLAFSWRLSLKEKFPDKKFIINFFKGNGHSPIVTFFQADRTEYKSEVYF